MREDVVFKSPGGMNSVLGLKLILFTGKVLIGK